MALRGKIPMDGETLHQLAGFTGFGWSMSVLGYLSTLLGYGNSVLGRLAADPQSFLYLGAVFFLATLGLDRLVEEESDETAADS